MTIIIKPALTDEEIETQVIEWLQEHMCTPTLSMGGGSAPCPAHFEQYKEVVTRYLESNLSFREVRFSQQGEEWTLHLS